MGSCVFPLNEYPCPPIMLNVDVIPHKEDVKYLRIIVSTLKISSNRILKPLHCTKKFHVATNTIFDSGDIPVTYQCSHLARDQWNNWSGIIDQLFHIFMILSFRSVFLKSILDTTNIYLLSGIWVDEGSNTSEVNPIVTPTVLIVGWVDNLFKTGKNKNNNY